MEFFDVVFPQNLNPLTYRVSDALKGAVRPGMLVSAELKKTAKKGIVLRPALTPPQGEIKEIKEVIGQEPVLSNAMLRLMTWMSEYYFAKEGAVLKSMLPREFFEKIKPVGQAIKKASQATEDSPDNPLLRSVRESIRKKYYKTFLFHAFSTHEELSFLTELIKGVRNIIILCPDIAEIRHIEGLIKESAGERLTVFHSGLSKGKRTEALQKITSGVSDIVLGSRSAVFAPLKEVSLIAVLHEESTAYKEEGGVRFNARDIAVMRGYLEGATVVLSSICPSVESYHNAKTGKYTLLEAERSFLRPKVRVVDLRSTDSFISRTLRRVSEARIKKGERVMFIVNRRGYSMLRCRDCNHFETCNNCHIPLVFHKEEKVLRCRYCGRKNTPPEVCPKCGGLLVPAGAGLERVKEELMTLNPVGVEQRSELKVLAETDTKLVIGTKLLARRHELREGFSLAAVLNADAYLYVPDFRSKERAYQELVYTAEKVASGGELFIQTFNPRAALFNYIRRFNFRGFYEKELSERKSLMYPPFSRMALLTVEADTLPEITVKNNNTEILGPVPSVTKRGKHVWKILCKASSRKDLGRAAKEILRRLKGFKVSVDVDPISV
jgi:primosomal protein N' (replication factor Y)